jgi:hypothetical protein
MKREPPSLAVTRDDLRRRGARVVSTGGQHVVFCDGTTHLDRRSPFRGDKLPTDPTGLSVLVHRPTQALAYGPSPGAASALAS